jgi:hypothetical protein
MGGGDIEGAEDVNGGRGRRRDEGGIRSEIIHAVGLTYIDATLGKR